MSPLEGLSILEASGDVAVRYCGRLFAQLGARVTTAIDPDDRGIGFADEAGRAYGRWLDQGKTAMAGESAGAFDLVIAGQDPASVAAAHARHSCPVLGLTWFYPSGPYADWRGTDEIITALTGLAYSFGPAEGPPTLAQGHGPQLAAGLTAFNAAMAALFAPPATRPRRIDVNVFEAAMCFTETGALGARAEGGVSQRLGVNRFVPTYPCSSLRTADGWVGVTALTPQQWWALAELIGRPEVGYDERYETSYERLLLGDEIDAILEPVFLTRTSAEWVAGGDANRIPITPMLTPGELPSAPHWVERRAFEAFDESRVPAPGLPFRMRYDGVTAPLTGAGPAPLSGLRVLDFSMGWAGPLCARTLGDMGAEVIKVESEAHPDWWRGWEADTSLRERRHNFIDVNRNKRGIVLDLTTPQGLRQAKALVAQADVVIENFAAGVMDRLGLGQDVQRALRPGLISITMPAFGAAGPLSGLRAYGSTVEQACGLPFVNGEADWPPALQHVAYGDPLAGLYATAAILSALRARGRLGGADIDLAQVACLFQFGADAIIAWGLAGEPIARTGARRARCSPVCVVRGQGPDSWLAVAADSDEAWRGLCGVLGRSDVGLMLADRSARADEIEAAIAAWAAARDPSEAARLLQAAGVPAAPVQAADRLTYDPQLEASEFWPFMDRAHVGRHRIAAAPFAYDGVRPALRRPAPTLGEHTAEVLGELAVASPG